MTQDWVHWVMSVMLGGSNLLYLRKDTILRRGIIAICDANPLFRIQTYPQFLLITYDVCIDCAFIFTFLNTHTHTHTVCILQGQQILYSFQLLCKAKFYFTFSKCRHFLPPKRDPRSPLGFREAIHILSLLLEVFLKCLSPPKIQYTNLSQTHSLKSVIIDGMCLPFQ